MHVELRNNAAHEASHKYTLSKKNKWKWKWSTRAEKVMQQAWWLTSCKNFEV